MYPGNISDWSKSLLKEHPTEEFPFDVPDVDRVIEDPLNEPDFIFEDGQIPSQLTYHVVLPFGIVLQPEIVKGSQYFVGIGILSQFVVLVEENEIASRQQRTQFESFK